MTDDENVIYIEEESVYTFIKVYTRASRIFKIIAYIQAVIFISISIIAGCLNYFIPGMYLYTVGGIVQNNHEKIIADSALTIVISLVILLFMLVFAKQLSSTTKSMQNIKEEEEYE